MKANLILILCVFSAGCVGFETVSLEKGEAPREQVVAAVPAPAQPQRPPTPKEGLVSKITAPAEEKGNLTNIHHVTVGMKYGEVAGIMGKQITIGYQQGSQRMGTFAPVTIENPHRQEVLKADNKMYNVVYYFTHIRTPDGQITDDELTPLVFENDELIGKGWTFLLDMKKRL